MLTCGHSGGTWRPGCGCFGAEISHDHQSRHDRQGGNHEKSVLGPAGFAVHLIVFFANRDDIISSVAGAADDSVTTFGVAAWSAGGLEAGWIPGLGPASDHLSLVRRIFGQKDWWFATFRFKLQVLSTGSRTASNTSAYGRSESLAVCGHKRGIFLYSRGNIRPILICLGLS